MPRFAGAPVELWDDVHERGRSELAQQMAGDRCRGASSIGVVRGRAQAFEADPNRGAFVADEVAPASGSTLLACKVAAEGDRTRPGDQHDAASGRVAGVERRDGVVCHLDPYLRTDDPHA